MMNRLGKLMTMMQPEKTTMVAPEEALPGRSERAFEVPKTHAVLGTPLEPPFPEGIEVAYFALGCFWGAERLFWELDGVYTTAVGYQNGTTPNPTYEEVCTARTGHAEAVLVAFDPRKVSYADLLKVFFEEHDPTQGMRQGNDVGTQYRSAIFFHDAEQERTAKNVVARLTQDKVFPGPIVTEIVPAAPFYVAEEYHQEYYDRVGGRNPYCTYVIDPKVAKLRAKFASRLKAA